MVSRGGALRAARPRRRGRRRRGRGTRPRRHAEAASRALKLIKAEPYGYTDVVWITAGVRSDTGITGSQRSAGGGENVPGSRGPSPRSMRGYHPERAASPSAGYNPYQGSGTPKRTGQMAGIVPNSPGGLSSTFFNEIGEYDRRFVDDSTSDRAIFSTELDSTNTTRSHGIGVLAGAPDDGNVDFRFRSEPSSPRQSNHLDSLGSLGASSSLCDRESLRQNSHEIPNFSMHALGSSAASSGSSLRVSIKYVSYKSSLAQ